MLDSRRNFCRRRHIVSRRDGIHSRISAITLTVRRGLHIGGSSANLQCEVMTGDILFINIGVKPPAMSRQAEEVTIVALWRIGGYLAAHDRRNLREAAK